MNYHSRNSRINVKNTTDSFNAVQIELHLNRISGTRDLLPVKYELLKKQTSESNEVSWILIAQKTKITQEDLNYNFNSYFLGEEGLHTFKVKVHFNDGCFIESEELNYTYQLPPRPLEIQDITYNDNCENRYSFSLEKQELIQSSGLGSRASEVQSLYLQFLNGTENRAGVIKGVIYDYFESLGEEKTIDFTEPLTIIANTEETPNGHQGEANFKYKFILKNGNSTELKNIRMYKNCLNDNGGGGGGSDPYQPGQPMCTRCFWGEIRNTNPIENNFENLDSDKVVTIFKRKYNSDSWCIFRTTNESLNTTNYGYSEHEVFTCEDLNNGNYIDQLQENELEDTIKIMNGPYNTTFKFQLINFQNRFEDVHTIDISEILINETIFTANFSTFVNIQNLYVSEELYNKIHSGQISIELRNDYFQIYMSPGDEPNKILLPTGINWQQVIKKK